MSQAIREQRLRWAIRDLRQAITGAEARGQRPFAADVRKLAEAEKDLAKIEARATKGSR